MSVEMSQRIAALSPEQRELLIQRLREEGGPPQEAAPELPRMPETPLEPGAPAPLTDIQETYWIGRSGLYDLGGCGANIYLEYEFAGIARLYADSLNTAMQQMIDRHPILRTVVDADGALRLLQDVPPFVVQVEDLSRQPADQIAARLERVRDEMRYARPSVDRWPLFELLLHQLPDDRLRLHARFDALLLDGTTRGRLLGEIIHVINERDMGLPALEISFLDYARALAGFRDTDTWARARDYWMARLPTLPPPLSPPLARAVSPDTVPRLVKRETRMLEPEAWREARRTAARIGVSPTALLATAFAESVRPWSATPGFTLGLVGSYKPPVHPAIDYVLGNFNTVQVLAVETSTGSFEDRARRLQQRIATDLDQQAFSGHRVLREWNRRERNPGRATLPVLFDSVIEYGHAAYQEPEPRPEAGETGEETPPPRWNVNLTEIDLMISLPQVLVLAIAIEDQDGGLSFVTQAVEEVLVPDTVPDLLDRLKGHLDRLGGGEAVWLEAPEEAAPLPAPVPAGLPAGPEAPPAVSSSSPARPWGRLEHELAGIWEVVLGRRPAPGGSDDFFTLGGDSLAAARLLARVRARWGRGFSAAGFFAQPTLEAMAESLRRSAPGLGQRLVARVHAAAAWLRQDNASAHSGGAFSGMRMFFILWAGLFVSGFGTTLGAFALSVWLFQKTKSTTQFTSLMFMATATGLLLAPLAGSLADRFDRRRILIAGELASGLMAGLLCLMLYTEQLQPWMVYPFVLIMVSIGSFTGPALSSSVSLLVPRHQLTRASGMSQTANSIGMIIGPLSAGAALAALPYHGVIMIDLCSFVFAILALLVVRIPKAPASAQPVRRSLLGDFAYGFTYLRARPGLLYLMCLFLLTNFSIGMVQATLGPLILSFASPAKLGIIDSIAAAGGIIGGVVLSVWGGPRTDRIRVIAAVLIFQGMILLLGGVKPNIPLIAGALFCFMVTGPLIMGANMAIWQSKVEHSIQGRVFAMRGMIGTITMPFAFLIAGPLADKVFQPLLTPGGPLADSVGRVIGVGPGRGVGLMYMILGVFVVTLVCLFYLNPRLRRVETELPDAPLPGEVRG